MTIDLSDAYEKLLGDHHHYEINDTLRYDFVHNGYECQIFHVDKPAIANVFTIIVKMNQTLYPFPLQIVDPKNVSEYIPPEIYPFIKWIIKDDDWKISPFFNHIKSAILSNHPVYAQLNIEADGYYRYEKDDSKPYFWHFRRSNLSKGMKEKIFKSYPKDFSGRLIKFCTTNNVTTCFTSDISKATDIKISMEQYDH